MNIADYENKVSVVIPAYNAEKYIASTLRSVMYQTFINWEAIVIDDCSTDRTCEIVREISKKDERVSLIKLRKNYGAPAAPRNIGVNEARGEWIAFLDADDIWHPEKLKYQMQAISKHGADFCSTKMKDFTQEEKIVFRNPGQLNFRWVSFEQQLRKLRTPTSSVVVRKSLMVAYPFNEDLRYKAREDFECWLRVHEYIGKSIKIEYPLLNYRIIRGQISGSKLKMIKKTFMVLSELKLTNGRGLRGSKYYYFLTYLVFSLYYRVIKKSL